MKVLIYGTSPRMESGMGKVGKEMAVGLARNHDVHYYNPGMENGPPMDYPPGADHQFTIHGSPGGPPGNGFFGAVLNRVGPDLVLTNKNWQGLRFLQDPLNERYTRTGEQTPLVMYGPPIESEHYPPRFREQLLVDHLQEVWMVPYTRPRYEQYTGGWDVDLSEYVPGAVEGENSNVPDFVPHGVDHDIFHPRPEDAEQSRENLGIGDRFVVTCIAENWRRKNLDLLMDGFRQFKTRVAGRANPVLHLHAAPTPSRGDDDFYGGWNLAQTAVGYDLTVATDVEHIDEDTDVFWTVKFPGHYAPRERVASMLSMADLYCLPTSGEAFSLTTLEAHACGTPVLQTDVETLRWVSDGTACFLDVAQEHALNSGERHVTPKVSAIANGLTELYDDPEFREKMATRGRERAEDFSWWRMGNELNMVVEWVGGRV